MTPDKASKLIAKVASAEEKVEVTEVPRAERPSRAPVDFAGVPPTG
jgi:hypothetical protein